MCVAADGGDVIAGVEVTFGRGGGGGKAPNGDEGNSLDGAYWEEEFPKPPALPLVEGVSKMGGGGGKPDAVGCWKGFGAGVESMVGGGGNGGGADEAAEGEAALLAAVPSSELEIGGGIECKGASGTRPEKELAVD